MNKIIAAVLLSIIALPLSAQNAHVDVRAINAADHSLVFETDIDGYGSFTVQLHITDITNCACGDALTMTTSATPGHGSILALAPEDASKPVTADFFYYWLNGRLDAAPDEGFVYRLPLEDGSHTTAHAVSPVEAGMARANIQGFHMWNLEAESGATIYAMRKGIVIYSNVPTDNSSSGTMIIEHADGTQARYAHISCAAVQAGDTVYPDTRIASAGQLPDRGHGVQVAIYRYATNRHTAAHPDMIAQTEFLDPLFLTAEGTQTLTAGEEATVSVSRKLIKAEKKNFWQRLFGL